MRGSVPSAVLTPIIRQYVRKYQAGIGAKAGEIIPGSCERGDRGWIGADEREHFANATIVLSKEVGMHPETLAKHLKGDREWFGFDVADRLLCKMDLVHLWFQEPLKTYYYEANLKSKDWDREHRPNRKVAVAA